MDLNWLDILITAVLAIPGGAGIWHFLSHRRDQPLRAKEVENATQEVENDEFEKLTNAYNTLASRLEVTIDRLEVTVDRQGKELASQGDQIKELRDEVRIERSANQQLRAALRTLIREVNAFFDDLHNRWDWHRQQDAPPARLHLNHDYE